MNPRIPSNPSYWGIAPRLRRAFTPQKKAHAHSFGSSELRPSWTANICTYGVELFFKKRSKLMVRPLPLQRDTFHESVFGTQNILIERLLRDHAPRPPHVCDQLGFLFGGWKVFLEHWVHQKMHQTPHILDGGKVRAPCRPLSLTQMGDVFRVKKPKGLVRHVEFLIHLAAARTASHGVPETSPSRRTSQARF